MGSIHFKLNNVITTFIAVGLKIGKDSSPILVSITRTIGSLFQTGKHAISSTVTLPHKEVDHRAMNARLIILIILTIDKAGAIRTVRTTLAICAKGTILTVFATLAIATKLIAILAISTARTILAIYAILAIPIIIPIKFHSKLQKCSILEPTQA
jgi:hypothetical protein